MKRRLLFLFLLFSSILYGQNNIYRSGGITQTIGAPTFTPGASGNVVAIDTVTGEWYVNPNRLSGSSWISAGYRLTNISGSVPPAYTPTAHQSHFVVNAANQLYYWDGAAWQTVGGGSNGDATRLKFVVVNKSGGTLNKGEVVYVSGAQGNRVAVKKALATSDTTSANTLGVMDETVLNNNEGYCVAEGLISGLNTSAFTEGAALYLSPTTAGAITQTKPVAPNHMVLIGYCVKSNNGSGEISVHIDNGYELDELHNVRITTPSDGQVLTYDATNLYWKNATVADQSATNEIQTIDTFSLSGQTLSASLSSDAQAAKTVTLPIIDVVAGTNVTVSKANGIATVSATGGGGGSGTVTGTGVAGRAAFWRSTSAISSDANFAWDSTNVRLNIGAPSSPTGRLNVKGSGTLTTVNTRLTNSGDTELLKVLDNGSTNIGTGFNWDNANNRLGINSASGASGRVIIASTGQRNLVISSTNNETTGSVLFTGGDNAFFSSEESFNICIDADNNQNNRVFAVRSNTYGSTGGNNLFSVDEAGNTTCGAIQTTGAYRLDVNSTTNTFPTTGGLRVTGLGIAGGKNTILAQNSNLDGLFKIEDNGKITYWANDPATVGTGAVTINRPSGYVKFAAGTSSLVVTNSLCTTSSIVLPVIRTNDATAIIKNVVPGSGSFTINLNAATTAETSVGFFIIN